MGWSLSWLAIESAAADAARARLGLEPTRDAAEPGDAPLVGCALPGGWYLVVARGCDHELVSDAMLGAASADGDVVACSVDEHVMFSSATCWTRGRERWRVSHDAGKGLRNLVATGEPPPELAAIRDEHAAKQDAERIGDPMEVDWWFEIPLVLARGIVGFKHDEGLPAGTEGAFVALRLAEGSALAPVRPRGSWWRFW
jgi:hypothetical protein